LHFPQPTILLHAVHVIFAQNHHEISAFHSAKSELIRDSTRFLVCRNVTVNCKQNNNNQLKTWGVRLNNTSLIAAATTAAAVTATEGSKV